MHRQERSLLLDPEADVQLDLVDDLVQDNLAFAGQTNFPFALLLAGQLTKKVEDMLRSNVGLFYRQHMGGPGDVDQRGSLS